MSVAKEVENIVLNNFVLSEIIARDIVNYRKLAKLLIKQYDLNATVENVSIILQRLRDKLTLNPETIEQELYEVNVRNNIINLTVEKNEETKKRLFRIKSEDLFFTYIESRKFYEIICNVVTFEKIKNVFNEYVLYLEKDLSLITIRFAKRLLKTPGVLALILRNLAFNGININLIFTTHREISIVIKENDAIKAYNIITNLRKSLKT